MFDYNKEYQRYVKEGKNNYKKGIAFGVVLFIVLGIALFLL